MQKYIIPTLAAFILLTTGTAFAQQTSANHDLRVTIPEVVMIRIVAPDGETAFVAFDYADPANQGTYFTALEAGGGVLPPTSGNITDIEVLAIGTAWTVSVTATAFSALGGVGLDDITVTPDASFGTPFTLDDGTDAMTGSAGNWTSLGIDWESYALTVNGDETDGTETITVTYTIANP